MRHLFDRIVELPAPVMSSLLERVPRPVHPASTFAFLADGPPEGMVAGPPSAEQIPVDEDTLGDLTEALQLACRSRTALILLDRSPAGQDLICAIDQRYVVGTFFTHKQTCLLSLPLSLETFRQRLIQDIGRHSLDEEGRPDTNGPGLIVSGIRLGPGSGEPCAQEVRNAMFVGPAGRRWLVVPPPHPSRETRFVRLDDRDLELFVTDLLHERSTWGGFAEARAAWESVLEGLRGG